MHGETLLTNMENINSEINNSFLSELSKGQPCLAKVRLFFGRRSLLLVETDALE